MSHARPVLLILICAMVNADSSESAIAAVVIDHFIDDVHIASPAQKGESVTTLHVGPFDAERRVFLDGSHAEPRGIFDINLLHLSQATLLVESVNPIPFGLSPTTVQEFNYAFSTPVDLTDNGAFDAFFVDFHLNQGPVPPQRLRLLVRQNLPGDSNLWEQSFRLRDERLEPFTAVFPFAAFFARGGGPFAPPFTSVPEFEATFLNLGDPNGQWEIRLESIRIGALPDADYNGNGHVEQADLDLVLLHWGDPALPAPLGWYHDLPQASVDQSELDHVLLNWGNRIEPPGHNVTEATIPEPTSALLMLVAAGCNVALTRGVKQRVGRIAMRSAAGR